MNCPACGKQLEEMGVGKITVDVCNGGCGGIWFDRFELSKVDESQETEGEVLLDLEVDENINMDHEKRRNCPRCEDMVMMRHFYSPAKKVEVDECPKCAGIWLDAGELRNIRGQYATEELKKQAAQEYFSEIFDGQLSKLRDESKQQLERAKRIAWIFRFICPSYYLPGKQKWGAF